MPPIGDRGQWRDEETTLAEVDAVREHLVSRGWKILSFAHGQSLGYDIHAARDGSALMVEAKGAGSGTPGTARFGKPFTHGQVITHVSRAVFVVLKRLNEGFESTIAPASMQKGGCKRSVSGLRTSRTFSPRRRERTLQRFSTLTPNRCSSSRNKCTRRHSHTPRSTP